MRRIRCRRRRSLRGRAGEDGMACFPSLPAPTGTGKTLVGGRRRLFEGLKTGKHVLLFDDAVDCADGSRKLLELQATGRSLGIWAGDGGGW